mgnify:FL=1
MDNNNTLQQLIEQTHSGIAVLIDSGAEDDLLESFFEFLTILLELIEIAVIFFI